MPFSLNSWNGNGSSLEPYTRVIRLPSPSPFYKVFEIKSSFSSLKKVQLEGAYAIESIGSKITAKELRKRLKLKEGREQKLFYLQNGRTKQILEGLSYRIGTLFG